jgi:pyruvate,water dikinase
LVAPLSYFQRGDLLLAGGKGANLGELTRLGLEVPPGFVITTSAYDFLLQTNRIQNQIRFLLASVAVESSYSLAEVSQQIRELFQQLTIPKAIHDDILKAHYQLDGVPVAVRSSATAEDLPEAAFAGQQETFLNVVGEHALIEAVRGCWMSLWSERAILYRARQHGEQANVKLAVVVQQMISADVAGVMFTANPITGDRNELTIDANPGLGESVVSGSVMPDHFVLNKRTRQIKEKQLGRKEFSIRARPEGGTEQINSTRELSKSFALPTHAVTRLAQLGAEIEHHYGAPQDIEWAWIRDASETGSFYILQSRPMTALPEAIKVSGPMRMILPMLAEMWPTRPYPLDMTTFTGAIERAIGNLLVAMIGKSAPSPDESFLEEDGVVVRFNPPQVHPSLSMLFTPWITIWRTRQYDPARWTEDPLLAEYVESVHTFNQRKLQSLTWQANLNTLHEALEFLPRSMQLRERYIPQTIPGLIGLWLLLLLARHRDRYGALVSGVKTKTTETNQALEDLAKQIRTDSELRALFSRHDGKELIAALQASKIGKAFLKHFDEFLDKYGHRETALTVSQPAWRDQPENVLAILKVLAGTEPGKPESYEAWQRIRDELLNKSILGSRILRNLFLNALTRARCFFQIREDTHFYATMVQPVIRHIALELGRRLVEVGALNEVSDVFHLRLEELEPCGEAWPPKEQEIAHVRSIVTRRKRKRLSLASKPIIDPRLLATTQPAGEGILLTGTSGSPGVAQGPARIIRQVSEFGNLHTGDILVAPVTNPAWTPLFQRAAAVVVDTGGSASHAAIVAREYGIPAVMGTIQGTAKLKDGQWITVDGTRGQILKAEEHK